MREAPKVDFFDPVKCMVGEIATASAEQAKGLDQVNQAMAQLNRVPQSNAAVSEESAAAAEELNAQAYEMMGATEGVLAMVDGAAGRAPAPPAAPAPAPARGSRSARPGRQTPRGRSGQIFRSRRPRAVAALILEGLIAWNLSDSRAGRTVPVRRGRRAAPRR